MYEWQFCFAMDSGVVAVLIRPVDLRAFIQQQPRTAKWPCWQANSGVAPVLNARSTAAPLSSTSVATRSFLAGSGV